MLKFSAEKELKKLNSIVKNIPADKVKLVEGLVADASFMAEQLEILREHIAENGWSETYQNGANQSGKKTSVEGQTYLQMQKSYAAIIRQLTEYLPEDREDSKLKAGEAFAAAVAKGRGYELR